MEPFKNRVGVVLIDGLAARTQAVWPKFDAPSFREAAARGLDALELKARVDQVARTWRHFLPEDYPAALTIVLDTLPPPLDAESGWGDVIFLPWIHAHFVQIFGLDHPGRSLEAMVAITQRGSCEFAVRPYLRLHPEKTRSFLEQQLNHPSPHVRRWISEGTRPRLPWGEQLKDLVRDPSPNLVLLDALRNDPSKYVRTSVANHLGDIAKDHPQLAIKMIMKWRIEGFEAADWIAKKALRLLIKKGDPDALEALGYTPGTTVDFGGFTLDRKHLSIGEGLTFRFWLVGTADEKLNVDYGVDFKAVKGGFNRKIFKLKSVAIKAGERLSLEKRHVFKPVTTRRLIPGKHAIVILVNGVELGRAEFHLRA